MIVLLAGGGAFLFSVIALTAGLHSMAVRYGLAALTGYMSFALLIRGWIAMRRGDFDLASNLPIPDFDLGGAGTSAARAPRLFMGGRSGGGGSTGDWADTSSEARSVMPIPVRTAAKPSGGRGVGGFLDALDSDNGWKVVAAAALVFAAVLAAAFVVYSAPTLLAEIAVDAGVMTTVYRRIRQHEVVHWTGAVLRHTWLPALVIIVFMAGAGYLLQMAAPEARSIGGVVRALTSQ